MKNKIARHYYIPEAEDSKYAILIAKEMRASALARGIGIAYRSVESICEKMEKGHAVIATTTRGDWAGFCYLEVWENGRFVSNSGMIVSPKYREQGIAKSLKRQIFDLSRNLFPNAHIFCITSGSAMMKLNSKFGFEPVSFTEITRDLNFWQGCQHCVNYSILESKKFKNCLCTAKFYEAGTQ
jgi:GNAT superfamily N-acetyltransferase